MKGLILVILMILSVQVLKAQISAITANGDEVVLYEDGTWEYVSDSLNENSAILINEMEFFKNKASTFLVKSNKVNVGIWMNPKIWSFTKGADDEAAEYHFTMKGEDLYGMLISEKTQIPVETLKGIAIQNARDAAPDTRVMREEFRNVNGTQVLMMQMKGTIQGIRFIYYGYYYSDDSGTIQFLAYTSESLFKDYLDEIEAYLNGLVIL